MGNSLRQLALVLQVAEELHLDGKLQREDYLKLVHNVETDFKNSTDYLKDVKLWLRQLLGADSATGHIQNLDTLLFSFLESPDADDLEKRVQILQLVKLFKNILVTTDGYNEKLLIKQLRRL